MGITPWSLLKSGVLSGKYTWHNHSWQKAACGTFAEAHLTDRTHDIVDAVLAIAHEKDSTTARRTRLAGSEAWRQRDHSRRTSP